MAIFHGFIERDNTHTVYFTDKNVKPGTMFEVRTVITEDRFENVKRNYNEDKFEKILEEEGKWADSANNERKLLRARMISIIFIISLVHLIIGSIIYLLTYRKYKIDYRKINKIETNKYDIYRDIPREDKTNPIQIGVLYYFNKKTQEAEIKNKVPRIFSAIILDFISKEYFKVIEINKRKKFALVLKKEEIDELPSFERGIYRFFIKCSKIDTEYNRNIRIFEMEDIKKYINTNPKDFAETTNSWIESEEATLKGLGVIDSDYKYYLKKYKNRFYENLYLLGSFALVLGIPEIIVLFMNTKISSKIIKICKVECEETAQLKGLKKYIEEYSMIKDKEVLDIVLWEKYLICATVFGIAKKVLDNLKINYPEVENFENNNYVFNRNFSSELLEKSEGIYKYSESKVQSEKRKAYYRTFVHEVKSVATGFESSSESYRSSSDGSGGGFSGSSSGGGGGGRRPEWVEDKKIFDKLTKILYNIKNLRRGKKK